MSFRLFINFFLSVLALSCAAVSANEQNERLPEFPSVFEISMPVRNDPELIKTGSIQTDVTKRDLANIMRVVISKIAGNLSKEEGLTYINTFAFAYMKQNMAMASGYRMIPTKGKSRMGCLVVIDPTAFANAMPLLMPSGKISIGTLEGYIAHEIAHCYEHNRVIAEAKRETPSALYGLLPTKGLGFHRDYELVADVFSLMYMKKYNNSAFAEYVEDLKILRERIAPTNSLYSYSEQLDLWIHAVAKEENLIGWDEILYKVKKSQLR